MQQAGASGGLGGVGAREMVAELNERINILMAENAVMADQVLLFVLLPMLSSRESLPDFYSAQRCCRRKGHSFPPALARFLCAANASLIISAIRFENNSKKNTRKR